MSLKRSVSYNSNWNSNNVEKEANSLPTQQNNQFPNQEAQQHRFFNSPENKTLIQETYNETPPEDSETVAVKPHNIESPDQNVSATSKALYQVGTEKMEKKKWKKGGKSTVAVKRKKLNQKLSKLLAPKSALILLHELKPGCVYKVQEQPGSFPPYFCAQVELDNTVLGTGQGLSKSLAKNCAAESAIKTIVSRILSRRPSEAESEEIKEKDMEDSPENLPWAGLASFAIYKMFCDWQCQDPNVITMAKHPPVNNTASRKELPLNAAELNPAIVLNLMNPGLTAVEIEREGGPKFRVKMGYKIDGRMFTGTGGNKKTAKKEAAKAVLEGLYGLNYP